MTLHWSHLWLLASLAVIISSCSASLPTPTPGASFGASPVAVATAAPTTMVRGQPSPPTPAPAKSATAQPAAPAMPAPQPTSVGVVDNDLTPAQQRLLASLPSQGPAPELENDVWLNSPPLRLAGLRGKVVLLEMWTFGCINCIHTIPSVRSWHHQYKDAGLVVIGNHMPEFSYESDLDNVTEALVRLDVPYPVAIDNDRRTWRAYNNRYWPTLYLIDKHGDIRYVQIGEGNYARTEEVIQALLAEPFNR